MELNKIIMHLGVNYDSPFHLYEFCFLMVKWNAHIQVLFMLVLFITIMRISGKPVLSAL